MIPSENLKYSKDHEWVEINGETVTIGITNYAQVQLGDIVYVELPDIGLQAEKDEAICAVESVKTAADVITPVSGEVLEVNEALEDNPELINEDPYIAWIMKIKMADITEIDELLSKDEYADFCENEG
ncbi:MAG: glycine cleavage system protein GcvH [Clostridiales bacterium]|nr:glycine cleavage system protein GcvH [Clostridiales bacterium]